MSKVTMSKITKFKDAQIARKVMNRASKGDLAMKRAMAKEIGAKQKTKRKLSNKWADVAKTAIRQNTIQKELEEKTKQVEAQYNANKSLETWNSVINNNPEPAENTGNASAGTRGVKAIGNE